MIVLDRTRLIASSGFSDFRLLRKCGSDRPLSARCRQSPTRISPALEEITVSD
jgi:hypothetical protein